MVQTPIKSISLEDFLKRSETKPASEFVAGQIIQKPMPQGKHSTIQGDLVPAINTALKPERIARATPNYVVHLAVVRWRSRSYGA